MYTYIHAKYYMGPRGTLVVCLDFRIGCRFSYIHTYILYNSYTSSAHSDQMENPSWYPSAWFILTLIGFNGTS